MTPAAGQLRHQVETVMIAVGVCCVRAYQMMLRPLLIGSCKFHPTCSDYAIEALRLHGPWRGGLLAARRLVRCHPFTHGRIDPVPPGETPKSTSAS